MPTKLMQDDSRIQRIDEHLNKKGMKNVVEAKKPPKIFKMPTVK